MSNHYVVDKDVLDDYLDLKLKRVESRLFNEFDSFSKLYIAGQVITVLMLLTGFVILK
jgi:hypothetical protein